MEAFSTGPTRIQLRRKDPTAWQEFHDDFAKHSPLGLARCMQGVVMARKTILQMEAELREIKTPTFIMVGDEDEPCIEPGLFMKSTIPNSGLCLFPHCGHLLNLEEPELFNAAVLDFLIRVEKGAWPAF